MGKIREERKLDIIIGKFHGFEKTNNLFWLILSTKILWFIWKARNEEIYQGRRRDLIESLKKITLHSVFV